MAAMTAREQWAEHRRRLQQLVDQAEQLISTIADQADRDRRIDRAAFTEGYRLGFEAGREIGWNQAEEEMARQWTQVAGKIRGLSRSPTFAELQARRAVPLTPQARTGHRTPPRPRTPRARKGRAA